jgi:hypothetical protein
VPWPPWQTTTSQQAASCARRRANRRGARWRARRPAGPAACRSSTATDPHRRVGEARAASRAAAGARVLRGGRGHKARAERRRAAAARPRRAGSHSSGPTDSGWPGRRDPPRGTQRGEGRHQRQRLRDAAVQAIERTQLSRRRVSLSSRPPVLEGGVRSTAKGRPQPPSQRRARQSCPHRVGAASPAPCADRCGG